MEEKCSVCGIKLGKLNKTKIKDDVLVCTNCMGTVPFKEQVKRGNKDFSLDEIKQSVEMKASRKKSTSDKKEKGTDYTGTKVGRPKKKRWLFWLVAIIVILGIIGNLTNNDSEPQSETKSTSVDTKKENDSAKQNEEQQKEEEEEKKEKAEEEQKKTEKEEKGRKVEHDDELSFGKFKIEDITTEIKDDTLELKFYWINQAARGELPFIGVAFLTVTQDGEELEEISGAYDAMDNAASLLKKNAENGGLNAAVEYKLNSKEPIEIKFSAMSEHDDTKEKITIDIE